MTYKSSLQGHFVSGRYTPITLLLLSLTVWGIGVFALPGTPITICEGVEPGVASPFLSNAVSLVCTVLCAFLLSPLHFSERRVHWLTALFLWIASLSLFTHTNVLWSVSAPISVLLLRMLFVCRPEVRVEGLLFAAFATLGFASLLMPQFLLLLPLGITYMSMMNVMGVKRIMAAILGLVTPLWLVYGTVYVYQPADVLLIPLNAGIHSLMSVSFAEPLPIRLLLTFADLAVLLPAVVLFAGSPVPGKPILRRRLEFLMLACVWLMLLSWLYGNDFGLFYVWRLPAIAILASYILTLKVNKATNVYFVFINLLWLAVAAFSIWQI